MRQLVPLFSLTARRVVCLSAIATVTFLAIRSTPTTQANRNQSGGEPLALWNAPASPPFASASTVNTLGDQADTSVGNGVCDVDNGTAGEQCTLRAAIQEANVTFAADTIEFSVTGTINLTGALPDIVNDLTISGPGSSQLTVRRDTGGDYRIFFINNRTINISGMTITNGRTANGAASSTTNGQTAAAGAGIYAAGGVATFNDLVVTGNRTGDGGDSTAGGSFPGGWGGSGGGVIASGTVTMTNVVISNNVTGRGGTGASAGGGGGAGGLALGPGPATLTNVTVTGNVTGENGTSIGGGSSGNSGYGGGIHSSSTQLTLNKVTISGNTTGNCTNSGAGPGAGLFIHSGTVTMVDSSITGNRTGNATGFVGQAGYGGGIANFGTLIISRSNISGNRTGDSEQDSGNGGGGIFNGFILRVSNSTISNNVGGSGNSVAGTGGGISSGATVTLTNCTITGNSSFSNNGPGVSFGNGPSNVRNTIIANNGPAGVSDIRGSATSQGHNLIGKSDGSNGFSNGANGDQVGTLASPLDPQVASLGNNGGPTQTQALLSTSPALDAGDNCVTDLAHCGDSNIPQLTTDQRGSGFNRIVDGPDPDSTARVDIGAYEKQAVFPNLLDASTNEDTPAIVAFDLDDVASVTSITATSSNSALVPNDAANISVVLTNSTAVLTLKPASNLVGTTNITVTVNRTGGSANYIFALTVVSVNDAPSFAKGPDQSVNENDPAQTVNNWATAISAGPADESGQTLTFQVVSNSNASLFSVAPAISSNGTLTYTPATGMSGTALITIRLSDNGGTANGGSDTSATQTFNINVLDGGALQFSSFSYSANESSGSALITVSRSGGTAGEARINYATTSNGTATAGQDYTSVSGTLTFANGVTSQTFLVPILGDTFDESDNESVSLTLSNPAGSGSVGSPSTSTLNISDDDPRPTVSINDVQLMEGNSGFTDAVFTVTVTGQTGLQVTVGFATANNTASLADYQPVSGQLTFNPGETTKTITVSVVGDTLGESNETFFVNLNFSINANIIRFRGTGTIFNDDTSVQFNSPTYSPSEGFVSVSFIVNRTGNTSGSSTVNYATSDSAGTASCSTATGNASDKCDYTSASGTLNFAPGETSKSFNVPLVDDGWLEGNESFTLTLTSPTGANLGTPAGAIVTIIDNDSAGAIPVFFVESGTIRVIALNSVTFVRGPFSVMDPSNFSIDGQTRLILYTSNLKLTQADPAYLSVQASGVNLPIEKMGTVTGVAGLDASYIVVRLPLGLPTGDLPLIVSLRGTPSTAAVLQIVP